MKITERDARPSKEVDDYYEYEMEDTQQYVFDKILNHSPKKDTYVEFKKSTGQKKYLI